ncbi:MAG: hypothetical protein EPO13_00760 [Actinomycetota bacterium]|nr:MAG: hypothetical protein EPO13_00760 [Actinomycetota bacterium]
MSYPVVDRTAAGLSAVDQVAVDLTEVAGRPWVLPVALGAIFLGVVVIVLVVLSLVDPQRTRGRVRRRLGRWSLTPRERAVADASGALGQSTVARSAVELAGRVARGRHLEAGLAQRLEAAGVPLKPGEWIVVHLGLAVLLGVGLLLLSGFRPLPTLIGLIVGVAAPYIYLSVKETNRRKAFDAALADTLQLVAGSLSAGYSVPQAFDTVARESTGPMAVELNKALVEARLGVPLEDALDGVADRMRSTDFGWVVMALRIQRDIGGNLSEILLNVAGTIRDRERQRRQVQVLSAEGRLSAYILGGLPLAFALYLILVRPEYLTPLVTTPLGISLLVVGVVLLAIGAIWLRKVVRVEV